MKRLPPELPHPRLRRALERLSSRIADPGAKLWFIKRTLSSFQAQPRALRHTPVLRSFVFHYVALESLAALALASQPPALPAPVSAIALAYRSRYLVLAFALSVTGYLGYVTGKTAYPAARDGIDWLVAFYTTMPLPTSGRVPRQANVADVAPSYPTSRPSPVPEEIWLVERNADGELWSNGLRVSTVYETRTRPRSYTGFRRDDGIAVGPRAQPAGILYHTSESDMAPFKPGFNRDLVRNTRGLLRWLRQQGSYHYLIDRFGRVYRIVLDSDVAAHAGYSIWADDTLFYLNLNDSFLGLCFESAWTPQASVNDIITSAQIQAAINLTDMLRAQYRIADINCVPHGLTSVNPRKMLIGYHLDWAHGFPFPALGLQDKYEVPLPSMLEFGFGYDEHLLEHLRGKLWPGIEQAEGELAQRARDEGLSSVTLREQLRNRYRQQLELLELLKKDETERAATGARPARS